MENFQIITIIGGILILLGLIILSKNKINKLKKELNASKKYSGMLEKRNDELIIKLGENGMRLKDQYILTEKVSEIELENIGLKIELKEKRKEINSLKTNNRYWKKKLGNTTA